MRAEDIIADARALEDGDLAERLEAYQLAQARLDALLAKANPR
jgi:hypothetical protein